MAKICFKSYCDKAPEKAESPYFTLRSKGAALVAGATYPARDSRSDIACRKVLEIGAESFIQRPSLGDVAVDTISTFINEGIYIYQEPGKAFLCSTALLYVLHGKARWVVSGNAVIYHFRDGRLVSKSAERKSPLFGERVRWNEKESPELDISHGANAFLLCSAAEDLEFPATLTEHGSPADLSPDEWAEAALSEFRGRRCSAAVVTLPL